MPLVLGVREIKNENIISLLTIRLIKAPQLLALALSKLDF